MTRALLPVALACVAGACLALAACGAAQSQEESRLQSQLEELDAETDGELGVFVKRAGGDGAVTHDASRPWYLSSTIKVPVAIVLMLEVEAGRIPLDRELTLKESDAVDGAGELQGRPAGSKVSVGELLEKMLVQSDSTATDLLIREVGEGRLNAFLRSRGFGEATTLLQVRYDAYGELHPDARKLTNRDFIELKRTGADERHAAFAEKIGVPESELRAGSVAEAFERYYRKGLNSAPLDAFGRLLEDLVEGRLLSGESTKLILRHMLAVTTGERRIKAGLPGGTPFAQKTGTQIARICNVGIVEPGEPDALIVAACVEKFSSQSDAEAVLARVGRLVIADAARSTAHEPRRAGAERDGPP